MEWWKCIVWTVEILYNNERVRTPNTTVLFTVHHCQWQWWRPRKSTTTTITMAPTMLMSNYAVTPVHIWYNIWMNLRHIAGFNFDSFPISSSLTRSPRLLCVCHQIKYDGWKYKCSYFKILYGWNPSARLHTPFENK